jgi:predicted PurR-regulated permease PerM
LVHPQISMRLAHRLCATPPTQGTSRSDTPRHSDGVTGVTEPIRDAGAAYRPPVRLRIATDGRNWALALIALLASVYALQWAGAVVIPLLLGLMCSYALSPAVHLLRRWHIPRAIGAAVLLLAALGSLGSLAYSLGDDAAALIDSLPDASQKVRDSLRIQRGSAEGPMEKVQRAATSLEHAAEDSGSRAPLPAKGVTRVQIERPRFNVSERLWTGTLGLAGFVGQALAVLFATYFLLASGDMFRRKMARVAGPTFGRRKAV